MLTSNGRLAFVGVASNLVSSWWLWVSSPTDSVRVWYPTIWSYLGEHFFLWIGFCCFSLFIFRATYDKHGANALTTRATGLRQMSRSQYAAVCMGFIAADLCASLFLAFSTWWWEHNFTVRLWYTASLKDYLFAREPVFLATLAVTTFLASVSLHGQPRT